MPKELTLFPEPLSPWVTVYKTPAGREEELPQLRNRLRAHIAASVTTPLNIFDICSPSRFSRADDTLPAVTEIEACG
jgi:hypothetical protein